VRLRTPLGSSIEYTDSRLRMVEDILNRHKEIVTEFALIGLGSAGQVNQGTGRRAHGAARRAHGAPAGPAADLRKELAPSRAPSSSPRPTRSSAASAASRCSSCWPARTCRKSAASRASCSSAGAGPGIGRLDTDLQLDLPQLVFQPDRARIAAAQLSTQDVALAVNMLTGGIDIAKFNDEPGDGQRYDIRVKGREGEFTQPSDLSKIWLREGRQAGAPRQRRLASASARPGGDRPLRPAVRGHLLCLADHSARRGRRQAARVAAEILPAGYQVKLIGQAEEFGKTQKYMTFAFVAGAGAALHGARQPVQLLPAAGHHHAGAAAGHHRRRGRAVAVRPDAQHLLDDRPGAADRPGGEELDPAGRPHQPAPRGRHGGRRRLRDACPIRMRPVLMTSATVILALFPAALGLGAGAETNQPLSIAVIGGMISSTLLTLVVVPAVYSLVERITV
jgi:HAE1 family hydrophobic/amphiphilic exporter-1